MEYQVEKTYLTIFLPAEVDHHAVKELHEEVDELVEKHHIRSIIFDFRDTNFMDSSGIGAILGRYRSIYYMGGEIWAVHVGDRMKKLLKMSGVTKLIHLMEEE